MTFIWSIGSCPLQCQERQGQGWIQTGLLHRQQRRGSQHGRSHCQCFGCRWTSGLAGWSSACFRYQQVCLDKEQLCPWLFHWRLCPPHQRQWRPGKSDLQWHSKPASWITNLCTLMTTIGVWWICLPEVQQATWDCSQSRLDRVEERDQLRHWM